MRSSIQNEADQLEVRYQAPGSLNPYARNARTHSEKQISKLMASIRAFGFNAPILVDSNNGILAGHARAEAAKRLGLDQIPTISLGHLADAKRRAFILADNKIAEQAGWDQDLLRAELKELNALVDLDFSLESTGFDTTEIDMLLDADGGIDSKADALPKPSTIAVSEPGDLWILGAHRLLVADARDEASYQRLMGDERAGMIFSDPPYNVPIGGHVSGLGKIEHREFEMASGEMSSIQFTDFLAETLGLLARYSSDGSIHFICMDWRHIQELSAAGRRAYAELKNVIVWSKTNAGMGTFYRSQHELVFAFKSGKASHINNFGLGETGRYRTNVWSYPGINSFSRGRANELEMHPTVKPVALVADAIRDVSRRGDIVLDAFGGSGTTLIAAEKTGRRARIMEIDPLYADVICRRWQAFSGKSAGLENGGTFEMTERARSAA